MPKQIAIDESTLDYLNASLGLEESVPESPQPSSNGHGNNDAHFDVPAACARWGIKIRETKQKGSDTIYVLEQCEFDSSHRGKDAAITQELNGRLGYKCFHDGCKGKGWKDLRRKYEPDYDKPKQNWDARSKEHHGFDQYEPQATAQVIEYQTLTPAMLKCVPDPEYFIPGILEKSQCGVVSGKYKSSKTTAGGVALAYALETGVDYLGHFPVRQKAHVGMFSGESGPSQLRGILRRVAAFHGDNDPWQHTGPIFSCEKLPKIGDARYMEALERWIVENGFTVVFIDPGYAALAAIGDSAGNYYKVAELLFQVTELSKKTGCVILIFPHMTKVTSYEPPTLADIQWSGFPEWSGQWLLYGKRREWDDQTGRHWLWMVAGGRSGHAGTYGLDIREGLHTDIGGKVFEATVIAKGDAFGAAVDAQHEMQEKLAGKAVEKAEQSIRDAFRAMGGGYHIKAHVFERSGTSGKGKAIQAAWAAMLRGNEITVTENACKGGNNRPCDGYSWTPPKA
jgi:hypothetical protein